ncbi:(R)-mandelonitrile lyase [Kineococcus rhizosphaerae]|uniref:Quercetin dioxygenase-like cupin family protein n=1 Tax=Kineococcus rhizosphaerae TaxID=559628 RepID=A0A2T0QX54_9ACTN|nr:cupin domain-containing protein [Kineococcus rhizosphaerae]PRY10475.1 quercetin dioxygenase-like cupin family protein [Kineococcus rhizosphaerae]
MQLNTPAPTQSPTATFTGTVLMTPLATGVEPSRLGVAHVRFTPGARTYWHVHPLGQVLHVTEGVALVGTRDGSVVRARAGDTVVCPPGEEHWHGATAEHFAAHLAIQESADDGAGSSNPVTWLEPVPQETYLAAQ